MGRSFHARSSTSMKAMNMARRYESKRQRWEELNAQREEDRRLSKMTREEIEAEIREEQRLDKVREDIKKEKLRQFNLKYGWIAIYVMLFNTFVNGFLAVLSEQDNVLYGVVSLISFIAFIRLNHDSKNGWRY